MNTTYRLVYSEVHKAWVAVAEHVRGRGKKGSVVLVSAASLLFGSGSAQAGVPLATLAPPAALQLPTGAQIGAGTVAIRQTQTATAAAMAIEQKSAQAIVNWQTFNVGANATVNIAQPSSSSALLNRVLDANPSQIWGQIKANGQVFLTNPSGVYFAPGANVNVGSFTATTHSISDEDFLKGTYRFDRKGSIGAVLNQGTITADLGGYIALLAPEVVNQGVVLAKQGGTVAMAAGERYTLQFNSNNRLVNVLVNPATIDTLVENGQAVQAPGGLIILSAQAANSVLGGVVKNSGNLSATGLVSDGGVVRLVASGRIQTTGSIRANATPGSAGQGGRIEVIADLANPSSSTQISGSLSAQGGSLGGDGGFIETSASKLQIAEGVQVSTTAAAGKSGTWLLDPNDFTVGASGNLTPALLLTALTSNDVTIQTSSGNAVTTNVSGGTGSAGGNGDITISSAISGWSSHTLTLSAYGNININAAITGTGTSALVATAATGTSGSINLGANVTTGGSQTYNGSLVLNAGATLQSTSAGVAVTGGIAPGTASALTVSNATASAVSGAITGAIALTKAGTGTLTLSGANTYTGATTVSAGTLSVTGSLSDSTAVSVTGTYSVGSTDTVGSIAGAGSIVLGSGFTLTSGGDGTSTTFSGVASGSGALAKSGSGTLTLSGANTYTGTTTVSAGTLSVTGSLSDSTAVSVTGTYSVGSTDTVGSIAGAGSIVLGSGFTLTSGGDGTSTTFSGVASGSGALAKSGSGTLTLSNTANSYSGGT
ncbi:MAG: autotransporter-associated beta strand repeat-containing protein, partial [Betaproteobacteria bacterium]